VPEIAKREAKEISRVHVYFPCGGRMAKCSDRKALYQSELRCGFLWMCECQGQFDWQQNRLGKVGGIVLVA
jgi:hypothetical protein